MIEATLDVRGLEVRLTQLPATLDARLLGTARNVGAQLQGAASRQIGPGGVLENRTGTLRRSLFYLVELVEQGTILIRVGFDLLKAKYGRIQELGGVVTAKNARFLTIPTDAVKTASGVARFSARDVIAEPEAFGYTGTFFAKGILFGREGKVVTPLFILRQSVVLPDRAPLA